MGYEIRRLSDFADGVGDIGASCFGEYTDFEGAGTFLRLAAPVLESNGAAETSVVLRDGGAVGFVTVLADGERAAVVFGVRDAWERGDVSEVLSLLSGKVSGCSSVVTECPLGMEGELAALGFAPGAANGGTVTMVRRTRGWNVPVRDRWG